MLIKSISAKGLKGNNFDQPLEQKTLIIGPNGSGKTARMTAINLLTLGYQPGVGKKPVDIMNGLATADKLQAIGQFEGVYLYRRFTRTKAGAKQDYCVDHKKANKDAFTVALSRVPKTFDLSTFIDLSDAKKIELLISLHGDSGELLKLDETRTELNEDLKAKRMDLKSKESAATEYARALSDLQLPAGTLAETQQEIARVTAEYKTIRDNLETAKSEKAKADAAEKAKAEAESKPPEPPPIEEPPENSSPSVLADPGGSGAPVPSGGSMKVMYGGDNPAAEIAKQDRMGGIVTSEAAHTIQAIIDAMEKGCTGLCAAKMIAKRELKKFINQEAA